jgi:hypothetical protein
MGVMFSLDECVANASPRSQKWPLASGTVQVDDAKRLRLHRDVHHPDELPVFEAFIGQRFADDRDEVTAGLCSYGCGAVVVVFDAGGRSGTWPQLLICELAELHPEHRERGVRACIGRQVDTGDLRVDEIGLGRLLWPVEQFVAVHDL